MKITERKTFLIYLAAISALVANTFFIIIIRFLGSKFIVLREISMGDVLIIGLLIWLLVAQYLKAVDSDIEKRKKLGN